MEVVSKDELFKVKVIANVIPAEKYEQMIQESLRMMNRPIKLGHVTEIMVC